MSSIKRLLIVIMSNGYQNMGNIAAQGAGSQTRRENFEMLGRRHHEGCHFPPPHAHRVYCQPAAFHASDGRSYHLMTTAYGASRPY